MSNWKKVYSSMIAHRAELVKSILEEHEIPAVIINKKESASKFGMIEVLVHDDNIIKALRIIEYEIKFE